MSAGSGTSLMVIVEDDNPRYRLQVSASGALAVANENMISVKQALREMASLHYDYAVHSSTSQREFLRDTQLVLGIEDFERIVAHAKAATGSEPIEITVNRPLVGHYGWASWTEFLAFMPRVEQFCRLSDAESIWRDAQTGDVDILCQSVWSFAAAANAKLQIEGSKKPRFLVRIGDIDRLLDLREPGDGDLPVVWQERLLREPDLGPLGPESRSHERRVHRLYRLVCQKKWSASVELEVEALLVDIGFHRVNSPMEDGANAVAAYFVASDIPLLGVSPASVVNAYGWRLIEGRYWSMLEQAEPSWKWRPALSR